MSVKKKPVGRERDLKRRYGMTEDRYNEILTEQQGRCGVCHRFRKLVVDHNHKTGKNRGLLCNNCNTGLGLFEENPTLLDGAKRYLQKHKP